MTEHICDITEHICDITEHICDITEHICDITDFPILDKGLCYDTYFKEQIVYFYFNLTRKNNVQVVLEIGNHFYQVLSLLKKRISEKFENGLPYLELFYRMVGETRDILCGKGEHDLSYCLLMNLYQVYPTLAIYALHRFVQPGCLNNNVFGSWRDIKHFCGFLKTYSNMKEKHPLIYTCIELTNAQLFKDIHSWKFSIHAFSKEHLSNVSKWIPREHKKFDWLFKELAIHWANIHKPYLLKTLSDDTYLKATNKAKSIYRKNISLLNKALDTTQIKQCSLNFYDVNPKNVSSYTTMKQNNLVFANSLLTKTRLFDRIKCSQLFKNHFDSIFKDGTKCNNVDDVTNNSRQTNKPRLCYKEKNPLYYTLVFFVKEAMRLKNTNCFLEIDMLNKQWQCLSKHFIKFENMVPLLDISFTMQTDKESFYFAIGISLLIAENNASIGKRIFLMDNLPTWIKLEAETTFIKDIEIITKHIKSNGNTALVIDKAFNLLKCVIIDTDSSPSFTKSLRFIFISAFSEKSNPETVITHFKETFSFCKKSPTIIFWNVSPSILLEIPLENNVQSISGCSYSILKHLLKRNYKINKNKSQFEFVETILNNLKYDVLGNYLRKLCQP